MLYTLLFPWYRNGVPDFMLNWYPQSCICYGGFSKSRGYPPYKKMFVASCVCFQKIEMKYMSEKHIYVI